MIIKEENLLILEKIIPQLTELIPIFQTSIEEDFREELRKEKDESLRTKGKEYKKGKKGKDWSDWGDKEDKDSETDKSKEVIISIAYKVLKEW